MRPSDDTTVPPPVEVHVVGALNVGALSRIRTKFDRAVALRPERVVVDLAACDFVDAAGVGLLAEMHQRVRSTGGRLTLRGASARLFRAMEAATVHWVLQNSSGRSAVLSRTQAW